MDISGNSVIEWFAKQGTLGAVLGVVLFVGYNNINTKIDNMYTSLNARIDSVHADLKADMQEIKDREKWFMDHVIKNGDRISRLEGKLEEREQGNS